MLIRNAEIHGVGPGDLRIAHGRIAAIGALAPVSGETVIDAHGGALLPGLHDHHIHLAALAVRDASVACGPPEVADREALRVALDRPGQGWLRGIGYHESVLGALPDAAALDELVACRPVRIQHRSGRMWLLNSRALAELLALAPPPPGLERDAAGFTGRLFDEDEWLAATLGGRFPDLSRVSRELAACGITGITDMSPANDPETVRHFIAQRCSGALAQRCVIAGTLALNDAEPGPWALGPAKLHLHEAALPDFDEACAFIAAAHAQGRGVAVHCVSEVELVFALAAFEAAGTRPGDRIEHASVTPQPLVARIADLGLHVCVQPHFVAERGERYLLDVEPRHHRDLYRLQSLADAGIVLAGGSDAPFGSADPWAAMRAAVSRQTDGGRTIAAGESLSPEAALALHLADPLDLARERRIAVGEPADLCLLSRPWREARERLFGSDVAMTLVEGAIVHERIDEPPFKRLARSEPAA
ncbi:hydrolase [Novosphingobium sp. PC22D]|uniref:amidohydrolase family protein n=1 Tax=Novosphingobium sp. PC22D TaxID=1962403 RepID=UPI000BF1F63E|nr:amidohydrolase family protein [Novosphingobium sp. PC22D]PEQ11844.1 hydrolase [Novosphingobium sp. PC22D]